MFHYFVCYGVVAIGKYLRMPLNRNETLLDEVLLEDGCISRQDDTAQISHKHYLASDLVSLALLVLEILILSYKAANNPTN